VTTTIGEAGDLAGLGPLARRALELAEDEAHGWGHDRVGTEHLLLGLLAVEEGGAARALRAAGVTLAAARHKVVEAVGTADAAPVKPSRNPPPPVTPTLSARAARSLERAVRFSHQHRSDKVASGQLLWGVLDVEGRAGQVLRGLGVDIPSVRAALATTTDEPDATVDRQADQTGRGEPEPSCAACGADLEGRLVFRRMTARSTKGDRPAGAAEVEALVFSCAVCGAAVGAHRA